MLTSRPMRRFALLAALALAATAPPAARAGAQGITFSEGTPFAEVLRRARAEKKPVMVDAYAVWCGPCKQLDRMTFADATVGAWARKNVVAAKVDAEKGEGRRLAQRYAVRAFPTILFLDGSGNELDRISGVFPPAEFIKAAESILAGRTPMGEAIAKLEASWDPALAGSIAAQLAQRNNLARLAPIARRAVEEDPDLLESGARETFLYFVSLEDAAEKLSTETLDLIESVAPRLAADPRVVILHLAASREQTRRGDARPSPSPRNRGAAPGPVPPDRSPSPKSSRLPARRTRRGRCSAPCSARRRTTPAFSHGPPRSSWC